MRLNLRAAGDVRWNFVYTLCANELILALSEFGGRVNFSEAGTEVAIDMEFDGRCESMR